MLNLRYLTVLPLLSLGLFFQAEGREYHLAAGPDGGNYFKMAGKIAESVAGDGSGLVIHVETSPGSKANLDALLAGKVDLAIVQSNVAASHPALQSRVRGIASLYTESLQIAVPMDSAAYEINDLRGLHIFLGEEGSGSIDDARRLLNAAGVFRTEYIPVTAKVIDLPRQFADGSIEAAILTAGVPHPGLQSVKSGIRLLGLSPELVKGLLSDNPDLVPSVIPADSYIGQEAAVSTVGVRALLLCRSDLDPAAAKELASAISSDPSIGQMVRATGSSPDILELADRAMPVTLHTGAADFFRFRLLSASAIRRWGPCLFVIAGVFCLWMCIAYGQKGWCRSARRNLTLKLVLGFLSIYLLSTVLIYYCERGYTPGFETLAHSLWSTIVYVLSGLESREPRTPGGRVGLVLLLFSSLGMLGSVAGKFASVFINHRKNKMPNDLNKHILICHWNNRGDQIIRQIHDEEAEPDTDILVASLTAEIGSEMLADENRYNLHHRVCDCETIVGLKSARAEFAKSVIVLADAGAADSDSRTIVTLLALRQLYEGLPANSRPHVVAECISHQRLAHMKTAGADEVVCSDQYGLGILAQSAIQKRLSDVYDCLLHYAKDSSEIYIVPSSELPERHFGMSFDDLCLEFGSSRSKDNPVIPLGIRKNDGRIVINPCGADSTLPFDLDDSLIVVAFSRPDLRQILGSS